MVTITLPATNTISGLNGIWTVHLSALHSSAVDHPSPLRATLASSTELPFLKMRRKETAHFGSLLYFVWLLLERNGTCCSHFQVIRSFLTYFQDASATLISKLISKQ